MDGADDSEPENGFIVVTQVGSQTFGIVVDGVFHTEEIVVKPMSSKLRHIAMFSGNTILGDGSVIMIIDPNGIAQTVGTAATRAADEADDADSERAGREDASSLLVFRAGSPQPKAVPLSLVTRLEEIDCQQDRALERPPSGAVPRPAHAAGARQRRGARAHAKARSRCWCSPTAAARWASWSTRSSTSSRTGSTSRSAATRPGVLGSAVIKGQATEIIDIGHFLPLAFEDWFRRKEMSAERADAARCCWSTTRRSSATCWRRCSRPPATT